MEVEGRAGSDFPARMWRYYLTLRLRYDRPVFPVALVLFRAATRLDRPAHVERVLGEEVNRFRFWRIGLPRLSGAEYVRRRNPLAPALAALMAPGRASRAAWKRECAEAVRLARVDPARKRLLWDCVQTYVPLSARDEAEFARLMRRPENRELSKMRKTWSQQMMEIGEKRGEKRGEIHAKRQTLLTQLRAKFGALPMSVSKQVPTMGNVRRLDTLLRRILTAESLAEMGLDRRS